MHLASSLAAAAAFPRPEKLAAFANHLPQEWTARALQATGTAMMRKRRLPAEQVVWLVLGMALFRDPSIVEAALGSPAARSCTMISCAPNARAVVHQRPDNPLAGVAPGAGSHENRV